MPGRPQAFLQNEKQYRKNRTYKFEICETFSKEDSDMKIVLDGMGGDHAPASVVEGAILAMR